MHCRAVDSAYDTRKRYNAIAARNDHAVIPPRKNAKLWKHDTPRGQSVQRSSASLKVSRLCVVATGDRISLQKPR
jgi:hypothetical protein